jgi:hypothetical protein
MKIDEDGGEKLLEMEESGGEKELVTWRKKRGKRIKWFFFYFFVNFGKMIECDFDLTLTHL